ncbi:MAG: ribonucleotide reductase N-terminal alpha domain-containing protein, partial [Candidatus Thorarchaeota archaeon]
MARKIGKNSYSDMSREILNQRYLGKDKTGKVIETSRRMFMRVTRKIAEVEKRYGATVEQIRYLRREFYHLMAEAKFLPNSPTLVNANRPNGMLSACFVLPIEDSIEAIFETVKQTALIQQAGGGTGFSFDRLRPTGDIVRSSGGKTSGPMSFMQVFSGTTESIQQGALRRGANMGMMSIYHPDILKFIHAKSGSETLSNFNLSVKVPDLFMKQLKEDSDTPLIVTNPRTADRYAIPHSVDINLYGINDLLPESEATDDCYTA